MSITTTRYIRKPLHVDAVRITGRNIDEVAAWCQGEVLWEETPGGNGTGKKYIRVRVHQPKNVRQTKAFVGDWLLYTDKGYKVYTHKAFQLSFDQVPLQDSADVITIAHECFVAADGSVLNWKGENYVPQEEPGDVIMGSQEIAPGLRLDRAIEMLRNGELEIPESCLRREEEIELVPATPENIAQAVQENEEARAAEEGTGDAKDEASDTEREAA